MLALLATLALGAGPSTPPNIVIFVADDLGVESLDAYGIGVDTLTTPTLDTIAAQGVVFENAWAYPVCSPTRGTLMTGRYGFRTGVGSLLTFEGPGLSHDEIILPEVLEAGGVYESGAFGKWHLGTNLNGAGAAPNLSGWPHFEGLGQAGVVSYYEWTKYTNGVESLETAYMTTEQVDSALAWIDQTTGPWLAYIAFTAPHVPLHEPPAHLHSVDLSQAGPIATDPRPYFKAMVEAMDTEMGRFLDSLGDELENTMVFFVADNGTQGLALPQGLPQNKAKGTLYELGIRVPLLAMGPGIVEPGRTVDGLTSTADFFATVADIAGVDLQTQFPGLVTDSVSLVPYLENPDQSSLRTHVYSEHFTPVGTTSPLTVRRTARDHRYKLIDREFAGDEAYDLLEDPSELTNLFLQGPPSPEVVKAVQGLRVFIDSLTGTLPASTHSYGCDLNEPDTLTVVGEPLVGTLLTASIDQPYATQTPGSTPLLLLGRAPEAQFPCGQPVSGWHFSGHGTGEILVDLEKVVTVLEGPGWQGPGQPVDFALPLPLAPALVGQSFFMQGALLGAPGSIVSVGLTDAARLTIGA